MILITICHFTGPIALRHSLSTALPRIFNSVDLASQSSRRSCGSLTTFLFYHVCLHSSRFCGRFFRFCSSFSRLPAAAVLFRPVFPPPRPFCPKNIRLDVACVKDREKRKFLEIFHVSRRKCTITQKVLRFTPPCYIWLSKQPLFLVPQSMLWYELEGTVAHRPVRFQYIIEYM